MSQKITNRIEDIFAHAVALDQGGRLRNTIYAIGPNIYILNSDSTVLLHFPLRKSEVAFENPVAFHANDYDSRNFVEEDGKIIFTTESDGFTRKKSCGTPEMSPKDVRKLFKKYEPNFDNQITLPREVLSLLDESLSHVEFSGEDGKFKMVQRNIYSGAVLEITRKEGGMIKLDRVVSDFGPIGLRTNDFVALYSFMSSLTLNFPEDGDIDYAWIQGNDAKIAMSGIIACCLYDELGYITETRTGGESNGRQEQEDGRSQQGSDRQNQKGKSGRRTKGASQKKVKMRRRKRKAEEDED